MPGVAQQRDATDPQSPLLFIQSGMADNTRSYTVGATWKWNWRKEYSLATATVYSEFSVGRWATSNDADDDTRWVTQIGVTPVLRLQPRLQFSDWFLEIGVGANLILPVYRNADRQFSTEFNFGDHLAVGRKFGRYNRQEIALRVQHFSNGGLKKPNPGENFLQLRYAYRY